MKALGDYIHERGLKFGIYSDAGNKTCGGWQDLWYFPKKMLIILDWFIYIL